VKEIACFISPHGYGHATRAIAVLEAIQLIHPDIYARIFTTVPNSLFAETISNFSYHSTISDIGLVQSSALESDIPATIARLDNFLPHPQALIDHLANLCVKSSLVLCDISPLGIMVAQHAGIPSVVVENFTWDWIYKPYLGKYPGLEKHIQVMQDLFGLADYRVQTEPLCNPAPCDLLCGPIFRRNRGTGLQIRERLGCGSKKVVLVTMGGVAQDLPDLKRLEKLTDLIFIFSGQKKTERVAENIILLERNSGFYHPDLLGAADLVVCKTGYSTVAECCQAGARVISVGRAGFPESKPLQNYLKKRLGGLSIEPATYENGGWLSMVPDLLASPGPVPVKENGADKVAAFLHNLL
jgi:hypothetical protein